ncbi:hypothetical protein C8R45DRAFT_928140 [Mycena sanguinolenta]|nr:hypothetical protein C8R45DRAFT_928140 [Mycena sanguinolenta]
MTQFSTYLTHNLPGHEDPLWVKCLVAFLFVINISQAGAVAYMAWFYCVTNFANPKIVYYNLWPSPFTVLSEFWAESSRATRTNLAATAVLAMTNQIFQTWKIYLFPRNKTFVVFLTATSLAACGVGITAAVKGLLILEYRKLGGLQPIVEANLALQCAIYVAIACEILLGGLLNSNLAPPAILTLTLCKSKTSFAHTDRILNRLIRTAVQSGSFTALFALGTLFSVRFSPKTFMLDLFALPIGRIYTHTMMDHFVSRKQFQHIPPNNGDIMSVPHFHVRSVGISGSSGVIEPISPRPTQTLPKVSKTVEGLQAENCGDLGW